MTSTPLLSLPAMRFTEGFAADLPADPDTRAGTRLVRDACHSFVAPTPVAQPRLLAWSDAMGETLGVARPAADDGEAAAILAGNRLLPGMRPYAARYGGHQFGHWAGQLGDGRAITLGETRDAAGGTWEWQLKGAGPTPYSRRADGRAVLRSSVREFLCSEAMHHLGGPTTRALSLVTTGEPVIRDMFYDGRPEAEPGAVVCRIAPSFLRFGNYEILAASGEQALLKRLVDHTITRHFPHLGPPAPAVYEAWFAEVCARTAALILHWQRVGFVHGVMNTDNMSILGLTIDYGPYGWLDVYDPTWTPNTTDAAGRRYCYGHQPRIAFWNLDRLAQALLPLFREAGTPEAGELGLGRYIADFQEGQQSMFAAKLGLKGWDPAGDESLVNDLLTHLQEAETDMTLFFRLLADIPVADAMPEGQDGEARLLAPLMPAFYEDEAQVLSRRRGLAQWLRRYAARVRADAWAPEARVARMKATNPKYVLRNYLAQQAIEAAAQGDTAPIARLLRVLARPYDEQPAENELAAKRPEWARHKAGCSALSCSS